jgi:hypothetical protein
MPEVAVRKRGRMGADRCPNQGPVVVIRRRHFPIPAAGILNSPDIPKQEDRFSQRAQFGIWEKPIFNDLYGIIASFHPCLKTIQQRIEVRPGRVAYSFKVLFGQVDVQLLCCQDSRQLQELVKPGPFLVLLLQGRLSHPGSGAVCRFRDGVILGGCVFTGAKDLYFWVVILYSDLTTGPVADFSSPSTAFRGKPGL